MIKVSKLSPEATIPTRKHPTDAGMDFYALEDTVLALDGPTTVRTGITIEIPKGYVGFIWPKSRNDHIIGAGVIDEGYQGEILIKLVQTTPIRKIQKGQAIAQLVLVPVFTPEIKEVGVKDIHNVQTVRGATGGIWTQIEILAGDVVAEFEDDAN